VFVVNNWWANTNHNIPTNCLFSECNSGICHPQILVLLKSYQGMGICLFILLLASTTCKHYWVKKKTLKLEQCLFNKCLFNRVKKFNSLWSLLRKVTRWTIWNEKNDLVFNNKWHEAKFQIVMWEGLIDYRTFKWQDVLQQI